MKKNLKWIQLSYIALFLIGIVLIKPWYIVVGTLIWTLLTIGVTYLTIQSNGINTPKI